MNSHYLSSNSVLLMNSEAQVCVLPMSNACEHVTVLRSFLLHHSGYPLSFKVIIHPAWNLPQIPLFQLAFVFTHEQQGTRMYSNNLQDLYKCYGTLHIHPTFTFTKSGYPLSQKWISTIDESEYPPQRKWITTTSTPDGEYQSKLHHVIWDLWLCKDE